MKSWFGSWFSSSHDEALEVTVLATGKVMTIGYRLDDGSVHTIKWKMQDVQASFDMASQSSKLVNRGQPGAKLLVSGKEAIAFIEQVHAENNKPWYKQEKAKDRLRAFSIFFGIAAVLVATYFLIVPWLSEKLATMISEDKEAQFGNTVYDALAMSSQQQDEATLLLNGFFDAMNVSSSYSIRIKVVKSEIVNAFALPGGIIVVYTGLLKQLETYPELAALLSHEFTHVNNKHSTSSIFRKLGSRVFLGLLFGNFESVTAVLIDQADKFKSLNYSRTLEKEADMEGLAILKGRKIDPAGFASLFRKLKNASRGRTIPEFLASHPDIDKRIEYIHAAATDASIAANTSLQIIFEKIKAIK